MKMKKASYFVLKKIQETSQQLVFLTQQIEMVLPTELLGNFQVCSIKENQVKICLEKASFRTLIQFYRKNIKQRCCEIFRTNKVKIIFLVSPYQKINKNKNKIREISEESKKVIASYANTEQDSELKKILLKLAK